MYTVGVIAGGCLAAVAGITLFVVAALQTRAVERSAGQDRVHELRVVLRRMSRIAWPLGGGAAGLCALLTRWSDVGPGTAAGIIVATVACLAFPAAAARHPALSAYARLRGVPLRALRSYRRMTVMVITIAVLLWPAAAALAASTSLAVRVIVLLAGNLAINPVLFGLLAPVTARIVGPRALPADIQARLSSLSAAMGVRVHGRMVPARSRREANARQVGWLPGLRYVLVTDYLLDELTPAEIDAMLAHELAHSRRRHMIARQAIACVFAFPIGLLLTSLVAHMSGVFTWGLIALCFAIGAGFARLFGPWAIRQELGADDLAAAVVGPAALAAALTRVTELNEIKRETSLAWNRDVGHPAMSMRLARLRPDGVHAEVAPEK
jgi:Zn-dependent protease with chaperone function